MARSRFISDTDQGADALLKRVAEHAKQMTAGIHEDVGALPHRGGKLTIAQVAEIAELGKGRSPRRSFIGDWHDENLDQNRARLKKVGEQIISGKATADQALGVMGEVCVGEIRQRIRNGIAPPNSPETIRRKGSSTPLIASGELWGSIHSKVGEQE